MKYYYDSTGPDAKVVHEAFIHCLFKAAKKQNKEFTIALPTKGQLKANTIESALGSQLCKSLAKNNEVIVYGITIKLMTQKLTPSSAGNLVLVIHPSTKYINDIINSGEYSDSVYVPWTADERQAFMQQYPSAKLLP